MARKPRIEYEGAFYHVITRGNQKQKIFKDPLDYRKFLEILIGYKQRYHFHLYAYILMSNHVHLLIETRAIPLSKILQGVNQRYTMYYNRRYKTVGTKTELSELLDTDLVLRMFSENKGRARKQYSMFMNDGATIKQEDVLPRLAGEIARQCAVSLEDLRSWREPQIS